MSTSKIVRCAATSIVIFLAATMAFSPPVSATVLRNRELADLYDRNAVRATAATIMISAPVAAEKAGFFKSLGKLFGKIAIRSVLMCGEAATGGAVIGSAIGGAFADPPVSPRAYFEECGFPADDISFLSSPEFTAVPFLGAIPTLVEAAIPMAMLIAAIPSTEAQRRNALLIGDDKSAALLAGLLNEQIDQLGDSVASAAVALNRMQAELLLFLAEFPGAMSLEAILALQNDVATEGLLVEERNAISLLGFSQTDIDQLESTIVGFNPTDINPDTAFGELAGSLTALAEGVRSLAVPGPANLWLLGIGASVLGMVRYFRQRRGR